MKWSDPAIQEFMGRPGFEQLSNYPLYSTKAVAAAAWSDKQFFQDSSGSATNGLLDTNMLAASQMAHPERFLVTSINVRYMTAVAVLADLATLATGETYRVSIAAIMQNTVLKFSVNGGNEVLTEPMSLFPAGNDQVAQLSTGGTQVNGWSMVTNAFPFLYPLESKVNFLVEAIRPSTTFSPTVALRMQIVLNGIRFRSKQR
jgi:hypothetical protein